jgi:hypothetical protein
MTEAGIDRRGFILGMITAFCECVGNECKQAALSPPFYREDLALVQAEAARIAKEQGVHLWLEENADIPAPHRLTWYLIYKFPEIRDEYVQLRQRGLNPVWNFGDFRKILSYGTVWGQGAEQVVPRIRETRRTEETVARVLLRQGDWPPPKA